MPESNLYKLFLQTVIGNERDHLRNNVDVSSRARG